MSAPEVVVFDLGRVLLDFDYGLAAARIASRSKASSESVRLLIDQSELLFRFEAGSLDTQQFFQEVRRATGFAGELQDFQPLFVDIFSPIQEMIDVQAEVRRAGIPTYIFSNTNDLAVEHIRERFPFFHNFDGYVFSYEHGALKPQSALYDVVEKVTGAEKAKILFLDDRVENVDAGRARGWNTIHHQTPTNTKRILREWRLLGEGASL